MKYGFNYALFWKKLAMWMGRVEWKDIFMRMEIEIVA